MIVGRRDDNQMEACLSRSNNISDLGVCNVARLQDLSLFFAVDGSFA